MLRRLNELRGLAHGRSQRGESFGDLAKLAMLLADCMFFHTNGCDYFTFRDVLRPVPSLNEAFDEATVMDAMVAARRTGISA